MSAAYKREQRRKELEEKRKKVAEARAKRLAGGAGGEEEEGGAEEGGGEGEGEKEERPQQPAKKQGLFEELSSANDLNSLLATIETSVGPSGGQSHGEPRKRDPVQLTLEPCLVKLSIEPRELVLYPRRIQVNLPLPLAAAASSTLSSSSTSTSSSSNATEGETSVDASPRLRRRGLDGKSGSLTALPGADAVLQQQQQQQQQQGAEKRELPVVEVARVAESAEFQEFLRSATLPVERALALNAKYDLLADYARGAASEEKTVGNHVALQSRLHDDRLTKHRSVTSLCVSSEFRDLLAVSYSASEHSSTDPDGLVLLWSLHNLLNRPEYTFTCQSPILSIALSPFDSNMVIGVRRTSLAALGGHSHPIFCLRVIGSQNAHSLLSISTDGRLCVWRLDDLSQPAEVMEIYSASPQALKDHASSFELPSSGSGSSVARPEGAGDSSRLLGSSSSHPVAVTCMAFSESETNSFLIGSEQGVACRILRHAKSKGVETTYSAHFGPVTAVDIHPSRGAVDFSGLFLTSSIDWTVKIWAQASHVQGAAQPVPLRSFEDSTDYVSDVKWSPVHPALFASADGSGTLRLWNLNADTDAPVTRVDVSPGKAINHLIWTQDGRKIITGDSTGTISVFDIGDNAIPSATEFTDLQRTIQTLEEAASLRSHDL